MELRKLSIKPSLLMSSGWYRHDCGEIGVKGALRQAVRGTQPALDPSSAGAMAKTEPLPTGIGLTTGLLCSKVGNRSVQKYEV